MGAGILEAFERVKDQIGFCGIWCGSCVVGNGTLRELTRRYEETTKAYGLQEWAPKDFDYAEFSKGLSAISDIPLCPGCLSGGGRDDCEIRACALSKNLDDCSQCPEPEKCEHAEILAKMRSGARAAGLFVKAGDEDREELLDRWSAALKRGWPCCVLFMNGG
ncbi:MAG: DUF3795 domain-containing protein [Gemmatimonadota bacterium]|nr:MAG: DUF3795 domain-containing protein [Gemmatimonadota bacterium]